MTDWLRQFHWLRLSCTVFLSLAGLVIVADIMAQQALAQGARNPIPDNVVAHRDIEYAKAGEKRLLLDIYVPQDAKNDDVANTEGQAEKPRALPLVVWIHGGAWRAGNKKFCPALRFTKRGYVAASISYRLSHEAIFPAQIEDCKAAIRWLRANAAKYSIDPERIGVWGSSAGGHLVALLGTSGDIEELEKQHGDLNQSSRVQAVCDFFGPTDFLRMDQDSLPNSRLVHDDPGSPESLLVGAPIQENADKVARANPITYVSKDDPPFLIVHGDQDPLVPWQQSKYLFEAMQKTGLKDVKFHLVKGAGHGFRRRTEVYDMVDKFFDRVLR